MNEQRKRGPGEKTRTGFTLLNFASGIGGQLLNLVLQFAVRTVFVRTLGKEYLGINGVFSNILSMLSLAELGVGSAILFKLYEPIAQGDQRRIASLMRFYRTAYRYIGLVIAFLGLVMIPLLPYLVKDYQQLDALHINAVFIYLLYLLKTVSSYFFLAYKSAIIRADQREYIINIVLLFSAVLSSILQIVFLLLIPDFSIYVTILCAAVIGENLVIAHVADRMYPYIRDKNPERIGRQEVRGLLLDCGALMIYRINIAVVKGTDNLVLSAFLGLGTVALYSNYYLIYQAITIFLVRIFGSAAHSMGSLHAEHNLPHEYKIYRTMNLITAVIGGTACVGVACVADELIRTWIGAEWVIGQPFAILIGVEVYTLAIRIEVGRLRSSMGLFRQSKFRPLASMIINLGLSILLVIHWGINGVILGTIVSDWATVVWYEPIILHRYGFQNRYPVRNYYICLAKNSLTVALTGFGCYWLCRHVCVGHGWLSVIVHAAIVGIIIPVSVLSVSWGTEEGTYLRHKTRDILRMAAKKIHKA